MTQRRLLFIVKLSALGFALPLAGCGDFGSDPAGSGTGGSDASAGGSDASTGGSDASAGGSDAGTGVGGTGGTVVIETPPDASCDDVVACGGDVAGAWFAVDSCLSVSGMADLTAAGIGCTEAAVEGTLEVTGNWTIADDGTLTDTTQTTGTIHLVLQPECKDVSHTVTQCDALAGPLLAAYFGFVREESDCVDSETVEGGCDCTGTVNQAGSAAFLSTNVAPTGLYATEGNTLTFTGYETIDYDYCVDGNFIHLTPATANKVGTVTGTVVFQRQP